MSAPKTSSAMAAKPPFPSLSRSRGRDAALALLVLALFVGGLAGLAAATGWDAVAGHIGQLTAWQIAALLGLSLVNYGGRVLRWHVFTAALGLRTTLRQDARHFLGGFALTVTPGRVGELVRLRWLRRETGWAYARTAPLVLADRASDLAAMGLVLALALALSAAGVAGALPVVGLALGAAYIVTHPALLSASITRLYRVFGRRPRFFAQARQAARSLAAFARPGVLAPTLALGAAGWLAEGVALYLLLAWMGADVGLWTAVAIFAFAMIAGGLTGAPGGIGGAEAAMLALLQVQGVPLEVSLPATAIVRLTTLWFAILIGLCVFPVAERAAARGTFA